MISLLHREAASRTPQVFEDALAGAVKLKIPSISCFFINLEGRQLPLQVSRRIVGSLASSCMRPFPKWMPSTKESLQPAATPGHFIAAPERSSYRSIHQAHCQPPIRATPVEHVDWCNPGGRRLFGQASTSECKARLTRRSGCAILPISSPSTPSVCETTCSCLYLSFFSFRNSSLLPVFVFFMNPRSLTSQSQPLYSLFLFYRHFFLIRSPARPSSNHTIPTLHYTIHPFQRIRIPPPHDETIHLAFSPRRIALLYSGPATSLVPFIPSHNPVQVNSTSKHHRRTYIAQLSSASAQIPRQSCALTTIRYALCHRDSEVDLMGRVRLPICQNHLDGLFTNGAIRKVTATVTRATTAARTVFRAKTLAPPAPPPSVWSLRPLRSCWEPALEAPPSSTRPNQPPPPPLSTLSKKTNT